MPIYRTPRRGVSYSQALAEAYASAPEEAIILDTLEFLHESFVEDSVPFALRFVRDYDTLNATLEAAAPLNGGEVVSFMPVFFSMVRPSESSSGQSPEAEISVDNVSRYAMPYFQNAKNYRSPITVIYRPYLASDLTGPHMNPPLQLTLRSVECGISRITGRAGYADLTNRRFPAKEYTIRSSPQLQIR